MLLAVITVVVLCNLSHKSWRRSRLLKIIKYNFSLFSQLFFINFLVILAHSLFLSSLVPLTHSLPLTHSVSLSHIQNTMFVTITFENDKPNLRKLDLLATNREEIARWSWSGWNSWPNSYGSHDMRSHPWSTQMLVSSAFSLMITAPEKHPLYDLFVLFL